MHKSSHITKHGSPVSFEGAHRYEVRAATEDGQRASAIVAADDPWQAQSRTMAVQTTMKLRGQAVRFEVEHLADEPPAPVAVARCPSCGEPAHASDSADDGRCMKCLGIIDACFFCHNVWGSCTCRWFTRLEDEGFEHGGVIVTDPNVSECGRFFVNPEIYYGASYKSWAAKR